MFISPLGKWVTISISSLATSVSLVIKVVAQSTPPPGVSLPPTTPQRIEQTIPQPRPLPSKTPTFPPSPQLQTPPNLTPPSVPFPLRKSFPVQRVEVLGSTVLQPEIQALIQQVENREVTFEELLQLRSQITQLYINNGYITSGAFLPNNQDLTSGVVKIQVIEGELERIEIGGLERLPEGYVRRRLQIAATTPLNQKRLENALQLLQQNPLFERVNAELTAGSTQGSNVLRVVIKEASPLDINLRADNHQSPTIGSSQGTLEASHHNLLGFGDRLNFSYGITQGLNLYDINYTIPINARDGTLSLGYNTADSRIIEEPFQEVGIRSKTQTYSLSFRQPISRNLTSEFALGFALDLRRSQTFILNNMPFSFSEGANNGQSNVTVIRFSQDWLNRSTKRVLAARSQFSFGIDAWDATINNTGTDGRFFSWLGQFQWVQQLSPRNLLVARINTQLTPDSLLSIERFSLGGVDTVRGYRQNQLVADNGIMGSFEVRIPLTADPRVFQLAPFFEIGTGWNHRDSSPELATIASIGLGGRWLINRGLSLRLDYGIPLIRVEQPGDSLQDNGLYFSLQYQGL